MSKTYQNVVLLNKTTPQRKPEWLKIKLATNTKYHSIAALLASKKLHTVCRNSHCPNAVECWGRGTATFMILGNVCTRNCRFCAVDTGKPDPVDENEPRRLAEAAKIMGLKWIVLTSVDRDDLPDGGANHFTNTIRALRDALPDTGVEALVPDFLNKPDAVNIICKEPPDILNHNIETVPRLYKSARPQANYKHSLWLIEQFAKRELVTKSGIMVGLGETMDEVHDVIHDLHNSGCHSLTIGQYLSPSKDHLPVDRYVTPDEFAELSDFAYGIGFDHVVSGPLVRSSYRAEEAARIYWQKENFVVRNSTKNEKSSRCHSLESGNPETSDVILNSELDSRFHGNDNRVFQGDTKNYFSGGTANNSPKLSVRI